jgi:hypothetical protein
MSYRGLTPIQQATYLNLTNEWRTARELNCGLHTLKSLVKKRVAETRSGLNGPEFKLKEVTNVT